MTSFCIKLKKRFHFHDATSEKADVNEYYRSGHWSAILSGKFIGEEDKRGLGLISFNKA